MNDTNNNWKRDLAHPVVLIALAIMLSVFVLIGAAIFGYDHGVLSSMARSGFARGLITYLFAVVTIGTAVVLVVSALTSDIDEKSKERFSRGKEVLSLLLGVFGTIVGFYFGSEIDATARAETRLLHVTPPLLAKQHVTSGESIKLTAAVAGGTPPYLYGIGIGDESAAEPEKIVDENDWIISEISAPEVKKDTIISVYLKVKDATGRVFLVSKQVAVAPKAGQ